MRACEGRVSSPGNRYPVLCEGVNQTREEEDGGECMGG